MKKIICFLFLTVAFATNAQTQKYVISGDTTYGNVAVSIIINGASPIFIGYLQTGTDLVYDLGRLFTDDDFIEIKAESTEAYVTIDGTSYDYYNTYLPYFLANNQYFDTPYYSCIREALDNPTVDGQGNVIVSCFVSTLPD